MYNKWGGTAAQMQMDGAMSDDDHSRSNVDVDRASVKSLEETQQSWLLGAGEQKKKKGIDLGCVIVSRRMCCVMLCFIIFLGFVAGLSVLIYKTVPRHHKAATPVDNYTLALHKALLFFDAQKSGKLTNSKVPWRGSSGLQDGMQNVQNGPKKDLTGGYYDAGDNIKFTFPMAYSMTLLSWSVIEYKAKYVAAKEYDHVRDLIKWGTDYFLKTFNYTVNSTQISYIFAQVGSGSLPSLTVNDHTCWEKPEHMDYQRTAYAVRRGSDLAGEMAAAMAAASIVFSDQYSYSNRCLVAAKSLLQFAEDFGKRGSYDGEYKDAATFYNSTSYWDEFIWGNAWLYYASGNVSYLARATTAGLAKNANADAFGNFYGVLSWDNKLLGAQVLLTRLRLMMSPPYPYETLLSQYNNETNLVMCSYLPRYRKWNVTKGGLFLFNYPQPSSLQYAATAAFMASLFADYLITADIPVWPCGPDDFAADHLKAFAQSQIDYILGKNPNSFSYVTGFSKRYPLQVHHRGASIPKGQTPSCTGGLTYLHSSQPNPNVINGAMVGGPNKNDKYYDIRNNYTYTEPTMAGNAGLVGALISLSEVKTTNLLPGVDRRTLFKNLPSMYISPPPPPGPWKPP